MDCVEPSVWYRKGEERDHCVMLDFNTLALDAGVCPPAHTCIDARPHVTGSDETFSNLNFWV